MTLASLILMLAALSFPGSPTAPPVTSTMPSLRQTVPPVEEVQRKALEYARLEASDITSWKKRVRYAALLPKLQVEYSRRSKDLINIGINDSVYVGASGVAVGPTAGDLTQNINMDQDVSVKAVWSFNEAVFNPDMILVSEESRQLARQRQEILAEVNKNYYERQKLMGEVAFMEKLVRSDPEPDKVRREIFLKRVAFDESGAALDALTGGWFGAQIRLGDKR